MKSSEKSLIEMIHLLSEEAIPARAPQEGMTAPPRRVPGGRDTAVPSNLCQLSRRALVLFYIPCISMIYDIY